MTVFDIKPYLSSEYSDQIGEALFHFSEFADTQPHKKAANEEAQTETWPIKLTFTAKQTPTKPVDYADHRIKGINRAPPIRHDTGAKSDGRDIEAQLHDER